ncbi:MAG: C40 family peptidase [Mogibacterium sp.]|nr:C40 family peptidase [Mogibacterium sp.]
MSNNRKNNRNYNRALSLILAALMVLTAFPAVGISAFALDGEDVVAENVTQTGTVENDTQDETGTNTPADTVQGQTGKDGQTSGTTDTSGQENAQNETGTDQTGTGNSGQSEEPQTQEEPVVEAPVYVPQTFKLSKSLYEYTGSACKPGVTVIDSGGNVIAGSMYTLTYSNNVKIGKASVKVTFRGDYSGTKVLNFTIGPKGTTAVKGADKASKFTIKWKKQTANTTGYQIQYSTSKTFASGNKYVTISGTKKTSRTITKLLPLSAYYVRVRTYKTIGKTNYYSPWSNTITYNKYAVPNMGKLTNGDQLAVLAKRYVGKIRYKWGGRTFAGVSCLGFARLMAAMYSVNLPMSHKLIKKVGKAVSYANAKPGDLICYGSHVGIYIGNGKMVDSTRYRHGVSIRSVELKKLKTVRRIVGN